MAITLQTAHVYSYYLKKFSFVEIQRPYIVLIELKISDLLVGH